MTSTETPKVCPLTWVPRGNHGKWAQRCWGSGRAGGVLCCELRRKLPVWLSYVPSRVLCWSPDPGTSERGCVWRRLLNEVTNGK